MNAVVRKPLWLAELKPRDTVAGAVRTLRLGSRGFLTEPADSPANARFLARLSEPPAFEAAAGDTSLWGALDSPTVATLKIGLDADAVDWPYLAFAGHPVTIWRLDASAGWPARETVFAGLMGQGSVNRRILTVPLKGNLSRLEQPYQTALFGGAGGFDGGADHEGKPKPVLYGWGFNLPPEAVDPVNRRHVFHDGQAQAVDAAYSGGNAGVAVTNDLANGRTTPNASIGNLPFTIDARGDASGAGFVDSHAEILARILVDRTTLTAADLDTAAFDALEAAVPGRIGYFVPAVKRGLREVVAALLNSAGAWLAEAPDGKLTCGVMAAPAGEAAHRLDVTDMVDGRLRLVGTVQPAYELTCDYAPNWRVLGRSEMAGGVIDTAAESFLGAAFRSFTVTPAVDVLTDYPEAVSAGPLRTYFIDQADATTVADRRMAIRAAQRFRFACQAVDTGYRRGDLVTVTHPHLQTPAGELMRVRKVSRRGADATVGLELWR